MKSLKRAITLAIVCVVTGFVLSEANAQKGEKTLGIAGGFASYNKGGYTDIYFQYTFANHFRIAPEVGYIFHSGGRTGFEFSLDMHFPFRIGRGLVVYPLAGFSLNNWNYSESEISSTKAGLDVGAGLDVYLTSNFKLSLQGKYSLMKNTDGGFINLGFGYVF